MFVSDHFLTAWDRVNVKKKEYFCSYEKKIYKYY